MNLPPAPSNPQAIAPACKPMATGAAIIVVNSPTPVAAMAAPATESPVSSPSTILAPPPVFFVDRGSEVPFLFQARSDLDHVLKSVIISSFLKWWVKSHRA